MFSPILTKVNACNLQYKDYAFLSKKPVNEELKKFVTHCHPKADIIPYDDYIVVINNNNAYHYYNYGSYFCRLNLDTQSKKWYKVS